METLKLSREFDRVFKSGRSVAGREMILFVYRRGRGRPNRVGFCVSKKLGKAVVRNLVRRRLREVYRRHYEKFEPGWDMVLLARKGAVGTSFRKLEETFLELVRRSPLKYRAEASRGASLSS